MKFPSAKLCLPPLAIGLLCGFGVFGVRATLEEDATAAAVDPSNVVVEDHRDKNLAKTHVRPRDDVEEAEKSVCTRWYGDATFTPSKVRYLEQLLAARIPPGATLELSLDRLDAVEHCDQTSARTVAAAQGGALAGIGVFVGKITPEEVPGGDNFVIRVKGTANGKAFEVKRAFVYNDLPIRSIDFPPENADYRDRLRLAFAAAADEIAKIAYPPAQ
jgi:hypothetical protein